MKSLIINKPAISIVLGIMLLITFSFFIHHPFPARIFSFISLLVVAFVISTNFSYKYVVGQILDKKNLTGIMILAILSSLLVCFTLRMEAGLTLFPKLLTGFSFLAVTIGVTEELIFRGWMQSLFKGKWSWVGILIVAAAHAAYKASLFLSPEIAYDIDVYSLFRLTFLSGIFLGSARYFSGSVWPAVVAHALFDLCIYGDSHAAWWVY